MALTLESLLALFNALKSDHVDTRHELEILKARVDELENDALLTETDLEITREELKALKAECAPILTMMANTYVGNAPVAVAPITAAVAPMPATAAKPMPTVAMAGGSAPTTTLKITLLKEVDLPTFLPKLDGVTSRSALIGASIGGPKPSFGYICVNFASVEQAILAYDILHETDPAYKVSYKQAQAKAK